MDILHASIIVALFAYAAASVFFLQAFPSNARKELMSRLGMAMFVLATAAISLVLGRSAYQGIGYYTQMSGMILIAAMSWITLGGVIFFRMRMMGSFIAPLATALLLIQFFTLPRTHVVASAPSGFAALHITLSIIGEAFAIAACAVSILFIRQQRALKTKQLDRLMVATPTLDKLERLIYASIWSGFILLTLGLITGAINSQFFATQPASIVKVSWALLVWAWYLVTLLARNVFSLPPRRIAQMTFVGLVLMAISLFGLLGGTP